MHVNVYNMMAAEEIITMNKRGMITIPKKLREKFNYSQGTQFYILELDGILTIIPIIPKEDLRKDLISHRNLIQTVEESHRFDLELEK